MGTDQFIWFLLCVSFPLEGLKLGSVLRSQNVSLVLRTGIMRLSVDYPFLHIGIHVYGWDIWNGGVV